MQFDESTLSYPYSLAFHSLVILCTSYVISDDRKTDDFYVTISAKHTRSSGKLKQENWTK